MKKEVSAEELVHILVDRIPVKNYGLNINQKSKDSFEVEQVVPEKNELYNLNEIEGNFVPCQ